MAGTKLELTWPGKNKSFELEPRILIEKPELSYGDPNTENILIHGDNLLALKALEQQFMGKVKCIYIDPPFNTGAAFQYYDDNLEHSIRLNLMKERMFMLKNLLANDGVILVHLDDEELHYLKVLMDEIFGRDKFVSSITIQSSTPSGTKLAHKTKTILKTKDTILCYKKGDNIEITPQYMPLNHLTNFNSFFEIEDEENNEYKISSLKDILVQKGILKKEDKLDEVKLDANKEFEEFCLKYRDNIFRRQPSMPDDVKALSKKTPEKIIKYEHNGETFYAQNGYRFAFLSGSIKDIDGEEKVAQLVCDLWTDISFHGTQYEGNNSFPAGKKPERLLMRILNMFTNPGDLVLDSFLGSGTTAAVAHKMGRKWIGIELGDHAYSHCKVRLDSVIDGEGGGISRIVGREGGGGYKFYELGPSVLLQDKYGNYIINPNFNSSELVQAICKIENFTYKAYDDNVKHGYSTEKDFIHVTTRHITQEIIKDIQENSLKDGETMLIVAKTFESNLDLPSNIQIKKIPTEILDKCEYNKDNYSLPITQEEVTEDD